MYIIYIINRGLNTTGIFHYIIKLFKKTKDNLTQMNGFEFVHSDYEIIKNIKTNLVF